MMTSRQPERRDDPELPTGGQPVSSAVRKESVKVVSPHGTEEKKGWRQVLPIAAGSVGVAAVARITPLIDTRSDLPTPVLYAMTGALLGLLVGMLREADNFGDRLAQGAFFALLFAVPYGLLNL